MPSRVQGSPSLDADINCTAVASYLPTLPRLAARHHLVDHGEATPSLYPRHPPVCLFMLDLSVTAGLSQGSPALVGIPRDDANNRRRRETPVLGGVTTIAENGDLIALSRSHRCPAPQGQGRGGRSKNAATGTRPTATTSISKQPLQHQWPATHRRRRP